MWYHIDDHRVATWTSALVMTGDGFMVTAKNENGKVMETRTNRVIKPVRIWL